MKRLFLCLVAGASVAFVIGQFVLGAPDGATFATAVDRLEAQAVLPAQAQALEPTRATETWVTVASLDGPFPKVVLLRNSRPAASFTQASVTITVGPGDLLELDGRAYRRHLLFRVEATGSDLRLPRPQDQAVTVGDIAFLARVRGR